MVMSVLAGGLGNQMFQVAAGWALAKENNDEFAVDIRDHRCVNQGREAATYIDNIFSKINTSSFDVDSMVRYSERSFAYNQIPYQPSTMIDGYFQSEKYFIKYRDAILDLFNIRDLIPNIIKDKYEPILELENTTSIHIRRGDYLTIQHIHPVCTMQYYHSCVDILPEDANLLIFTDDIGWCADNFKSDRYHIVHEEDYIDLYLMSQCTNNIIANSSFSWWGAWLNRHEEKRVFAPQRWFATDYNNTVDLIPDDWQVI